MKKIAFAFLVILGLILTSGTPFDSKKQKETPGIDHVIFMIGDGMGLSTLYAAMTVSKQPLNIEKCTVTGLQKTFSSNNYITDSGAAGTALACGVKTKNGMIGQNAQGENVKSILKIAEEKGLSTGLVAVTDITDATPASFIANNGGRSNADGIALDFLKTDIDVFIGGGYDHFGKRADHINLIDSLERKGYEVDTTMAMVSQSKAKKLAGLTYPLVCPYRLNGRGNMLSVATKKAIEILDRNPKGFFLMVEGSHIDHGGHDNNADVLVDEVLDFDEALGVVLDYAKKDGHTLVVVTADHETGGVSILGGDINDHTVALNFASKKHTAVMVPVFAFGVGAENFTGIFDNTDFLKKFLDCYGFKYDGKQ